jgi:hypothetical protein
MLYKRSGLKSCRLSKVFKVKHPDDHLTSPVDGVEGSRRQRVLLILYTLNLTEYLA